MAIVVIFMLTTAVSVLILMVELIFTSISVMNMSHVITEFSFGKYFPEITQPLDNSFEVTHDSPSLASLDFPC
jgi:predicted RND superfamily exporter protein